MAFLKIISDIIPEFDQRWGDIWFQNGYYIQRNAITCEYRLIRSNEIIKNGDFNECLEKGSTFSSKEMVRSKHAVIILHGIGRTKNCMKHIEKAVANAGFIPINVSYPSLFDSLENHGNQINELISSFDADIVSFIGYSLGGLVVRQALSDTIQYNVGRIVQIGTPNKGATMADVCKDMYSFKYIAGECGQTLRTDKAIKIKPLSNEFGIIAGGTGLGFGFNPLLRGDNDGLVKVEETYMDGAKDFLLVKSDHHSLVQKPETIKATINFIRTGQF